MDDQPPPRDADDRDQAARDDEKVPGRPQISMSSLTIRAQRKVRAMVRAGTWR